MQLWVVSLRKQTGLTDNSQRDLALNMVTKNTGGRRENIAAQSAIATYLLKYADGGAAIARLRLRQRSRAKDVHRG